MEPGYTVFVGSTPGNVEAAVALGFHGVVFTGTQALRSQLVAWGALAAVRGDGVG